MKKFQQVLSLVFAIHEINRNPKLLPNVTLGFHIHDNLFNSRTTHEIILDLLFAQQKNAPNYKCNGKGGIVSVIGEFPIESMIEIASIFNIYKIPQLSYGIHKISQTGKTGYPSLHWISPREVTHHMGIIQLLLHFQWTWIGLVVSDDDAGESFLQNFTPVLSQHTICVAFLCKDTIKSYDIGDRFTDNVLKLIPALLSSKVNVIVLEGDSRLINFLASHITFFEFVTKFSIGKVWIMPPQWYFSTTSSGSLIGAQLFQGALSFSISTNVVPGFRHFLQTLKPDGSLMHFLCLFWQIAFKCALSNEYDKRLEKCTGDEKLETLPRIRFEMDMTGQSYAIYNAVYSVASALHAVYAARQGSMLDRSKLEHLHVHPWQLQSFLENVHFNNGALHDVLFENGELPIGYDIVNWVIFNNQSYRKVQVGEISPNHEFVIHEGTIVWNNRFQQMPPRSKCVESCRLGHSQIIQKGKPVCCYDCTPCPENMISNVADAFLCVTCPQDQYPNIHQDQCIPKVIAFLSYQEPLGIFLFSLALSFAVVTCLVIQLFLKNWNMPIVRANNRQLSCILLITIFLCYLSSVLFIGKPGKEICLVRQTAFGILFSVSISCVLAKTIMVVLAFKATKPGNWLRTFLGKDMAKYIVLSCSLIQVGICIAWLSTFPPFLHVDLHSQSGRIILECDEGFITMFYCVLGYMGFLASISFTVAFFARKLPDTFNEAKFITFSMLMFCSVWISFLPAYLSTKGTNIVAVEIFAILASNTGLLACIFFPKCYILIIRTDLSSRKLLIKKSY